MEKTGGSRLLQMQARFQQKQLQEREMKIASLYEAQQARALDRVRHSPSSVPSPPPPAPIAHQPGKVRQMFEERRTKGIDKSYPLQPIHNTDRTAPRKGLPNGFSKVTATPSNTSTKVSEKKTASKTKSSTSLHNAKKETANHKVERIINSSGDVNHNHVQNLNSTINNTPQTNGIEKNKRIQADEVDNNGLLEDETFPEAMAPIATPQSPEKQAAPQRPPRKSPPVTSPSRTKPQQVKAPIPPQRKSNSASNSNKAQGAMKPANRVSPTSKNPSLQRAGAAPAGGGKTAPEEQAPGVACAVCGRRFASDRLQKHEEICRKAHAKKRKPFDALKHRLAGTEAEPFLGKLRKGASSGTSSTKVNKPINSTWRQKHQDFINAIRSAKQVQAHLNAGGKLSDLPPPPPSENPDYIQCPHCNRRFNQQAAERHIPKCATYEFNKSKPSSTKKK